MLSLRIWVPVGDGISVWVWSAGVGVGRRTFVEGLGDAVKHVAERVAESDLVGEGG